MKFKSIPTHWITKEIICDEWEVRCIVRSDGYGCCDKSQRNIFLKFQISFYMSRSSKSTLSAYQQSEIQFSVWQHFSTQFMGR